MSIPALASALPPWLDWSRLPSVTEAPIGWAIAGLLAALLLGRLLRRRRRTVFRVVKRPLLTDNEQEFMVRLEEAFPDYRVMAQVSMGALMAPDVRGGSADYLSIRGRFAQKVVDYVLLDQQFDVVALVELDDRTHHADRDADRDAMTAAAGYVTLRYQSRAKPEPAALRAELRALQKALSQRRR